MDDAHRKATQDLYALNADYWHDVDMNWGRNIAQFFTDDGVFEGGAATYRGIAKIQEFYQWRVDRGARVAVHAFTNFRVKLLSATQAECTWYLHLYAADGEPVLLSEPPISIAYVVDTCTKDDAGTWRYTYRKFKPLFHGKKPPTNPKLDEK